MLLSTHESANDHILKNNLEHNNNMKQCSALRDSNNTSKFDDKKHSALENNNINPRHSDKNVIETHSLTSFSSSTPKKK